MSMPIYGDMKDVTFQSHPFYPVVESPGVVFIVKKEDSSNAAQAVMEAVFQGWPVLLLTLIMAALSGIVVWALVSKCTLKSHYFSSTICYSCKNRWCHFKQFYNACTCILFVHSVSNVHCWKFKGATTNEICHKMYFVRIFAPQKRVCDIFLFLCHCCCCCSFFP